MHYFQFNIGDYASHTRHLDLIEDLAYRRLLDLYYLHERPLNTDATVVAKQIGMRDDAAAVREVLNYFFDLTPDGYRSSRADKEIEHYHSKIQQASRAGKASAERRMNGRSTVASTDVGTDVQPNNKQEPITNNQEPITKKEKTGASAEIVFPDGLDQEAWAQWVDYRKASGKALKPVSWPSAMQALAKHGRNQMAVIDQSIANGWQGLFALKSGAVTATHSDGTPLNKQEALEASNRAVVARFLAKEAQREAQ